MKSKGIVSLRRAKGMTQRDKVTSCFDFPLSEAEQRIRNSRPPSREGEEIKAGLTAMGEVKSSSMVVCYDVPR